MGTMTLTIPVIACSFKSYEETEADKKKKCKFFIGCGEDYCKN